MYVCNCRGITEEQLQNASQRKSKMKKALQELNVGKDCGSCLSFAVATYLKYSPPMTAHQMKKGPIGPIKQK